MKAYRRTAESPPFASAANISVFAIPCRRMGVDLARLPSGNTPLVTTIGGVVAVPAGGRHLHSGQGAAMPFLDHGVTRATSAWKRAKVPAALSWIATLGWGTTSTTAGANAAMQPLHHLPANSVSSGAGHKAHSPSVGRSVLGQFGYDPDQQRQQAAGHARRRPVDHLVSFSSVDSHDIDDLWMPSTPDPVRRPAGAMQFGAAALPVTVSSPGGEISRV